MAKLGQIKSGTMRVGNTTASGYGIVYADEVIGHRRVNTYAELKSLPTWCLYNKAGGDNIDTAIGQLWYVFNGDSSHPAGLYQLVGTDISLDSSWKLFKNGADVSTHDTTYTFTNGSDGSFTVTPKGGSAQTVSIGKPSTAGTADHAKTADSATKANSATSATSATNADHATSADRATQDKNGRDIANTYATKSEISALTSALVYKGTVDAEHDLPTKNVKVGYVYVVAATGMFADQTCEPGDMIIAQTASNAEGTPAPTWTVVQTNINGAVTTTDTLTGSKLIVGGGNRTIKAVTGTGFVKITDGIVSTDNSTYLTTTSLPVAADNTLGGIKIGFAKNDTDKNYPVQLSDDKAYVHVPWTDTNTTYPLASTSVNGLMSNTDKTKLDDLGLNVTMYEPTISKNGYMHLLLSGVENSYVDIPILNMSNDDDVHGFMAMSDKKKLDGIATGATRVIVDAATSATSTNPVQNQVITKLIAAQQDHINNKVDKKSGMGLSTNDFTAAYKAKLDDIGAIPNSEINNLF